MALALLGILAAIAVVASEMPTAWAWPLALVALACGTWLARREAMRPRQAWVWPEHGPVTVDGVAIDEVMLRWQGPLAFVRWRDGSGRVRRLGWWPDTLPPAARRELRLAVLARIPARAAASMAP